MVQPLMSIWGQSYEKHAVMQFLETKGGVAPCPVSQQPFQASDLVPNRLLEIKIRLWKRQKNFQENLAATCEEENVASVVTGIYYDCVKTRPEMTSCSRSSLETAEDTTLDVPSAHPSSSSKLFSQRRSSKQQRKLRRVLEQLSREFHEF